MRSAFLFVLLALPALAQHATAPRPRLMVLTDIGGDPDDQQSMVRLMTYSSRFDIEGLIASASGTPNELKEAVVRPDLVLRTIDAYGEVRANLAVHEPGFPEEAQLRCVVKSGNPVRGVNSLGDGHDTEGSRWIIAVADRTDARPLNISIWGGSTELAQALWRVRHDRTPEQVRRFIGKLRVYAIGHQDDTGPWIMKNFPDLFYILGNADPDDVLGSQRKSPVDKRLAVYRGMYLGGDESLTSREWIDANVRTGHGPLGALYPPKTWTAPNPHSALKEGDTPSWFYFLPTGLNDPEHPEWGGWGGRFHHTRGRHFNDAPDTVNGVTDARVGVWRWRPAYQNDFAARMDWCVSPAFQKANHAPQAVLNGDSSAEVLRLTAQPGASVRLTAKGSSDPDHQKLTYRWFLYPEAGSYAGKANLTGDGEAASLNIPRDPGGGDIHVILEVRDTGAPALFSYRRVVVSVAAKP